MGKMNEVDGSAPVTGNPAADSDTAEVFLVQAPVPPVQDDGVTVALVGTIAFALATAIAGFFYPQLKAQGNAWYLYTCLTGLFMGLCFYFWTSRRSHRVESGHEWVD